MIKTFKGKNTYSEFQWPLLAQADLKKFQRDLVYNNRPGFIHLSEPNKMT